MKWLICFYSILIASGLQSQSTDSVPGQNIFSQFERVLTLNTNFTVPIGRYNFLENVSEEDRASGRMNIFNSVGAGISINLGKITALRYFVDGIEHHERNLFNAIGLQLGFLFSVEDQAEQRITVFAPTVSLLLLDFQIGWGYEFGSKEIDETGHFMTISYGVPLQKLSAKGSWILKAF